MLKTIFWLLFFGLNLSLNTTAEAAVGSRGAKAGATLQDSGTPQFASGCPCPKRNGSGDSFLTQEEIDKPTYEKICMRNACWTQVVGTANGQEGITTHVNENPQLGPQGGQGHSAVETTGDASQQYNTGDATNEPEASDPTKQAERYQQIIASNRAKLDQMIQTAYTGIPTKGSAIGAVRNNSYDYAFIPLPSFAEQQREIARVQKQVDRFASGYFPAELVLAVTTGAQSRRYTLLAEIASDMNNNEFANQIEAQRNLTADNAESAKYHQKVVLAEKQLQDDQRTLEMYQSELKYTKEMAGRPTVANLNDFNSWENLACMPDAYVEVQDSRDLDFVQLVKR